MMVDYNHEEDKKWTGHDYNSKEKRLYAHS